MILEKPDTPGLLSIPDHRELRVGLLRGLIRSAGISVDEFLALLKEVDTLNPIPPNLKLIVRFAP